MAGVGAAAAVYGFCSVEEDDFFELPQPRGHSARTVTAASPTKRMVRRPYLRAGRWLPRSGDGIEPSKRGAAPPCRF